MVLRTKQPCCTKPLLAIQYHNSGLIFKSIIMYALRKSHKHLPRPSIRDLATFLFGSSQQTPCSYLAQRCIYSSAPFYCSLARLPPSSRRLFSEQAPLSKSASPRSHDRGPTSIEDTQTDFSSLDVLGNIPAPSTSIDACLWDGFHLNSGVKIMEGKGVLLVAGEAFAWSPWEAKRELTLINEKGQFDVEDEAWGLFSLVWPKPGMLVLCKIIIKGAELD